jgi:hypothetical protein
MNLEDIIKLHTKKRIMLSMFVAIALVGCGSSSGSSDPTNPTYVSKADALNLIEGELTNTSRDTIYSIDGNNVTCPVSGKRTVSGIEQLVCAGYDENSSFPSTGFPTVSSDGVVYVIGIDKKTHEDNITDEMTALDSLDYDANPVLEKMIKVGLRGTGVSSNTFNSISNFPDFNDSNLTVIGPNPASFNFTSCEAFDGNTSLGTFTTTNNGSNVINIDNLRNLSYNDNHDDVNSSAYTIKCDSKEVGEIRKDVFSI